MGAVSDRQAPLSTIANLLDIPVHRVRQVVAAARRADPAGTEEDILRLAFDALKRERQQASLDAAKRSIGR